jgi:anti-anti-sigma factor
MPGASTGLNLDTRVRELTVRAEEPQLGRVRDFMVEVCEEAGFNARETSNTKLAVDEACTNIIKHAYRGAGATGDIRLRVEIGSGTVKIHLHDTGKHFDFTSITDPDLDQYVETGRKGGLGIYLINRLMDGVEYLGSDAGNEMVLTKRGQAALPSALRRPLRGTLRYKFTVRAGVGLLFLVAVLWAFVFYRQSQDITAQQAARWVEKRRLAVNLAGRSVDVLMQSEEFSLEQTNLSADLARLVASDDALAWARVVDASGQVVASGNIDEIFTSYAAPPGEAVASDDRLEWRRTESEGRAVRDIRALVRMNSVEEGQALELGYVHVGVFEDAIGADIGDKRVATALLLLGIFGVGMLLIVGLVRVFVRPIQVLTDGVRAIGDGTLDQKLEIDGPAEIGAIASVFNEITSKFKRAQDSILEQEKMQKEIEVAKEIQQSLLPRRRPTVSGYDIAPLYQAAAEVGGDYYDFVQVDEDTIGIVVADVSGKGVPGSLVMTMIRTALRMEARGNKNASDVMSKMNAFVTDDMKKGMFVTMFYVILDSKNRTISYASAGHNPMILYRHASHETFFLNPKGFPVGISLPDEDLFRRSISLEKIKLKKDDMLVIYTDGVTEAMNERREQYGEARLLALIKEHGHLSPEAFMERLDADVKFFTSGHPQNDDITVVAVKEKLAADDVLSGIRRRLIELVEVQGLSVKEACRQMRVSPATYYRYKKRLELLGERGLKNDVLREDQRLKRVSLEARREILAIIAEHPNYGAKRIAEEYNATSREGHRITGRMVYEELKRLNLNTKELRLDYLRRNRLLQETDEGALPRKPSRELVEELLRDIPGVEPPAEQEQEREAAAGPAPSREGAFDLDGMGLGLSSTSFDEGVVAVRVNGHLDSVTSATLEKRIKEMVDRGATRIVIDLSEVTYISSGGWGIFTAEVGGLRQRGGDIVLSGMTSEVYDVYELLGFADVLRAFTDVAEARAYLALPVEERLSLPPSRSEVAARVVADRVEDAGEEIPGEGYAPEWESLGVEATTAGAKGDIAVISLRGIIDTVSAERLRDALARVIDRQLYRIVVDMSQVEYVSSGGWGTFSERLREVRRAGGDIKLFGMDPDVYYVFTMLGFNIVLASFDILSEALEDFSRAPRGAEHPGAPSAEPAPQTRRAVEPAAPAPRPELPGGAELSWEIPAQDERVARLSGAIEATAAAELAETRERVLADRPRLVLFDLSRVTYVSSTGWGQFAAYYEAGRSWGMRVALAGLNGDLHDVYACLEFHAFIPAFADVEAARAAMDERAGEAPAQEAPPAAGAQDGGAPEADAVDALSVDDILGPVEAGDTVAPVDPAPSVAAWPGDPVMDDDEPAATPPEGWGEAPATPAPDAAPPARDLDVESAVSDKNVNRDRKLRKLGWARYGDRLRSRRPPGEDDDGENG